MDDDCGTMYRVVEVHTNKPMASLVSVQPWATQGVLGMNDTVLDRVVDRISVDLCTTGRPRQEDVLLWARERWPRDTPHKSHDVAKWYAHEFLPVVEAAVGGNQ